MEQTPMQATPHKDLIESLLDICQSKTEREWAAFTEIHVLRNALLELADRSKWQVHDNEDETTLTFYNEQFPYEIAEQALK